jgi:hypothetical protein
MLAHGHDPLYGLAPGQELRLGDDRRAAPSCITSLAAALALGLEPGRAFNRADIVRFGRRARLADMDDGVGRVVRRDFAARVDRSAPLPAAPPAAARRAAFPVFIGWCAPGVLTVLCPLGTFLATVGRTLRLLV